VISLALGDPGDLVKRAHDAGIRFVQQVHTVGQAQLVAERGVDVIIAQGTEAGGFTGMVAGSVLVPQVVDAVSPIPVVAAGGIGDGRGLAAALVLGAQGVNVGTRFLASTEASISIGWKRAILDARAEDAVKADIWDDIFPKPSGGAFDVVPRAPPHASMADLHPSTRPSEEPPTRTRRRGKSGRQSWPSASAEPGTSWRA
jgi:nitronate monooxygenase/enoyl-[acyl-carrier protein] reductase II